MARSQFESVLGCKLHEGLVVAGAAHQAWAGRFTEREAKVSLRARADDCLVQVLNGLDEVALPEDDVQPFRIVNWDHQQLHELNDRALGHNGASAPWPAVTARPGLTKLAPSTQHGGRVLGTVQPPGTMAYAFSLGLVAAVNPCGFPLLPAYLAVFAGERHGSGRLNKTARALAAGAAVTGGFVVVFGVLGALVESGVRLLLGWVPWAMLPVAVAMVLAGALAVAGRPISVHLPLPKVSPSGGVFGMALFGVAYAVASLSCALPLFLAGVAGSFTRLGFLSGLGSFVAYALGMGLLLMVAALMVAHAGAGSLRKAFPATRLVPRLAGAVLVLAGVYLVLYWVNDLVDPFGAPAPVRVVEHVQTLVAGWLGRSPGATGAVLAVAVIVALAGLAWAGRRPARGAGSSPEHLAGPINHLAPSARSPEQPAPPSSPLSQVAGYPK